MSNKTSIREAHQELENLRATKRTVNDLLRYKRTLNEMGQADFDKINEVKLKAVEAINQLFNDIMHTPKTS